MLKSLKDYSTLPVTVYSEDQLTIPTKSLHDVPGWKEFQDDAAHIKPQGYLYDAAKFSHKVYAQLDAFTSGERYVVWLDGDIVFKADLTARFLKKLVKGHFCAYLGRQNCYSETGFIIFDTHHPDFLTFAERYAAYYDERMLFVLKYWIDCTAFDAARVGLQARDLTPDVVGMVGVFDKSPLKDIMEHDKGDLKYRREDETLSETA